MIKRKLMLLFILYAFLIKSETVTVSFYGSIIRKPEDGAPGVTMVTDGENLTVLTRQGEWLEVQTRGYRGWIHQRYTSEPSLPVEEIPLQAQDSEIFTIFETREGLATLFSTGTLLLLSLLLIFRKVGKKRNLKPLSVPATTLGICIVSRRDKSVASTISNIHKRLSACFREMGFSVHFIPDLHSENRTVAPVAHLYMMDYAVHGNGGVKRVEKLFEERNIPSSTPVVFYNIPEPSAFDPGMVLTHACCMGTTATEQDIIKIASDVYREVGDLENIILQGKVTGEGLYEVLQLIETGGREGLLQIRTKKGHPHGEMAFRGGSIIYAKTHHQQAQKAVEEILRITEGSFRFTLQTVTKSNCFLNPTAIMLQSVHKADQQQMER